MRRLAWLVVCLLALLTLASMCGSSPRRGYSPVYGDRYAKGKGYAPGQGGAAIWDTVYNVYTMNPALNHTAINGVDAQDVAIAAATALEASGRGNVYTLGVEDTTFAYAQIDTLWVPAVVDSAVTPTYRRNYLTIKANNSWNMQNSGSSRSRPLLVHFDPKVPAGATIVSAKLHLISYAWYLTASTDTFTATLMDKPGWNSWYHYRGTWEGWGNTPEASSGVNVWPHMAKCGYSNQVQQKPSGDRHGYHYATRAPWTPAFSTLNRYYEWGDVTDRTGFDTHSGGGGYEDDQAIDITDCVQAIANGSTNNGIMINFKVNSTGNNANRTMETYGFEQPNNMAKAGWIEVKYITKRYITNFPGGKTWAFVFQTDDNIKSFNDSLTTLFASRGGKYTIYATRRYTGPTGIANCNFSDLLNWHDQGMEVGHHGRYHIGAANYNISYYARPGTDGYVAADTNTAAWDSMMVELGPAWLYAKADSCARADLTTSRRWAKSAGLPTNAWSPWTTVAASKLGYSTLRCGGNFNAYGAVSSYGMAFADTAMFGARAKYGRAPRDVIMLPFSFDIGQVVGPRTNRGVTEAVVKAGIKKLIEQVKDDNTGVLSLYAHDTKANSVYTSGSVDLDEMGWILDVVDSEGGCYMTATEYGDWVRQNSTLIDTPASAHRDSFPFFKFEAPDGVWIKPDGIDNRWIRGLKNASVANSFDTTTPPAPTSVVAYSGDGYSVLVWTASATNEPVSYKIYRFFDGAADTTYLGTTNNPSYTDLTVVNGSPHNYFVTTIDAAGNESADSDHVVTTPGSILAIPRPAYYALWYQDPGETLSATTLDSLAAFDAVLTGPFPMEGVSSEPAYANFISELRSRNPDIIVLMYCHPWIIRQDGAAGAARAPYRQVLDWANAPADSAGWAKTVDGAVAWSFDYPTTGVINFMRTAAADSMARIWAEGYITATGVNAEYTGLFLDDTHANLEFYDYFLAGGTGIHGDIDDVLDVNGDADEYAIDAEEQEAYRQYLTNFVKGLRREFAQRGLENRLLVANSNLGRATSPNATATAILSRLDGAFTEGVNIWFPGNAAADTTWDRQLAIDALLTHAQVAPAMSMMAAKSDSNIAFQNEPLALANDSWVCANAPTAAWGYGSTGVPPMVRRLPIPGVPLGYDIQTGGSDPDTLTVTWSNYTARLITQRNAGSPDSTYAVWPYVIYTTEGDTLSRSAYWERAGEEGAPQQPGFHTQVGDNTVLVIMERCLGCTEDMADSDVSLFKIVSTADEGDGPVERTYYVSPDTLDQWDPDEESFIWYDPDAQNGYEYCYSVSVIDVLGNESAAFTPSGQCRTPADTVAPPAPGNPVAAGGEGFVDIDWDYPSQPADFDRFRITRRLAGSEAAFAAIDSVAISAYQDESAVSGVIYEYNVRAIDDDGLVSELPETYAVGAWYGTVDPTYPAPSNVRALADNPSGYTSVVIYPPSDQTGLTSYSVYRGRYAGGAAATDTTACTLYKTGLTPDAFGGHVFVDLHATNGAATDTAFQYTARALYSGNASEKYAVPAWALSTGGFSAQTPGCFAFGNGTNISVACMTLAGSDSTRIFRGTSAGTQSYVTTVAVANNPWTDTTALANTDYWYKLRQVDNGTLSQFSAVSGPARWTSVPSGNPAISGVTGTVAHDGSVVIAGSGFGAKSPAAPMVWKTFEEGAHNARLKDYDPDWIPFEGGSIPAVGGDPGALYSTNIAHSGVMSAYNAHYRVDNPNPAVYESKFDTSWMAIPQSSTVWMSYWWRMDLTTGSLGPLKMNRITSRPVSGGGGPYYAPGNLTIGGNAIYADQYLGVNPDTGPGYNRTITDWPLPNTGNWRNFQCGSVLSTPGVADGWITGGIVGHQFKTETAHMNVINTGPYQGRAYIYDSIYLGLDAANPTSTADWQVYVDDLYVDNTRARVELGNNATYTACTHREMQIPSAWSATGVTVTVNTGTFANGTAYLFVVNSDGVVSPGYAVTVSNP